MTTITTLARREFNGLFFSLIGYVVLAIYLLFIGGLFAAMTLVPGTTADMRDVFTWSHIALIFVVPIMTMGTFSEEYASNRIEMLRTSPVRDIDLLLGKFLGAMGFYALLIASTLVFVILLAVYGQPNWGAVVAGYFGLLLMGMLFVAIGVFFSAITRYQIVAVLLSLLTLVFIGILVDVAYQFLVFTTAVPNWLAWLAPTLNYLAFRPHMIGFAKGVVELRDVIYFVSGSSLFLLLTYLVLESRKWR